MVWFHAKARGPHPAYPSRVPVSDESVDWNSSAADYRPPEFTHTAVTENMKLPLDDSNRWADKEDVDVEHRWTTYYGQPRLLSALAKDSDGRVLNPAGRTGLAGRGLLGKWGPNSVCDAVVTRWNPDCPNVLQVACMQRKDTGEWALPGIVVGGPSSLASKFKNEILGKSAGAILASGVENGVDILLSHGIEIFSGYIDDPRNTDHAWMEGSAYLFHVDGPLQQMQLKAGKMAIDAKWLDITPDLLKLYGGHYLIVMIAEARIRGALAARREITARATAFTVATLAVASLFAVTFVRRS